MAFNSDRFVIIDGVQMSRERAKRLGLLKEKSSSRKPADGPSENKTRTADSTRKTTAAAKTETE